MPPRSCGRIRAVAIVAALTAAASGCSSNAFITRRRDLPVEAEIVGGSVNYVFVRDSGGEASIERIDIADVSHPGTGRMMAGAAIVFSSFLPAFPSLSTVRPVIVSAPFSPSRSDWRS